MISEVLKNDVQMFGMFLLILGINEDVIDEYHDELIKLGHEDRVHEIHEVGRCIGKAEDRTRNSYSPYRMEKAVLGMSHGRILI